jgi:hypothetical protein
VFARWTSERAAPKDRPPLFFQGDVEIGELLTSPACKSLLMPHGPQSMRTGESFRLLVVGGWPPATSITSMR